MGANTYFSDVTMNTIKLIYDRYLSKPYTEHESLSSYIDSNGVRTNYPSHITPKAGEVYRPDFGVAACVRTCANIRRVTAGYAQQKWGENSPLQPLFASFNEPAEIIKLELVNAFLDSQRPHNASPIKSSEDLCACRSDASRLFYRYASGLKDQNNNKLFSDEELQLYREVLNQPNFESWFGVPDLAGKDKKRARKAAIRVILTQSQTMDAMHYASAKEIQAYTTRMKCPELDSSRTNAHTPNSTEQALVALVLTGTKCLAGMNLLTRQLNDEQIPEHTHLLRLCNLYPDVATQLVGLSWSIGLNEAKRLADVLDFWAKKDHRTFDNMLTSFEKITRGPNSPQTQDQILTQLHQAESLRDVINPRKLIKTIRADSDDFWDTFADELVYPSLVKPELRPVGRKAHTVKLKNGQYVIMPTDKKTKRAIAGEELDTDDKAHFSRHQSTSYVNAAANYRPGYFGHRATRQNLMVGVSFAPEDCKLKRIMMYDNGTYNRPYDFNSEAEAKRFLQHKLSQGEWFTSLNDLEVNALRTRQNRYNEVMAKVRWTSKSSVTIFSNNLESRLLAQARAHDLRLRFAKRGLNIEVPITFYPNFELYHSYAQAQDLNQAKNTANLHHYGYIIEGMLSGFSAELFRSTPYEAVLEAQARLKQINKTLAKDAIKAYQDWYKTQFSAVKNRVSRQISGNWIHDFESAYPGLSGNSLSDIFANEYRPFESGTQPSSLEQERREKCCFMLRVEQALAAGGRVEDAITSIDEYLKYGNHAPHGPSLSIDPRVKFPHINTLQQFEEYYRMARIGLQETALVKLYMPLLHDWSQHSFDGFDTIARSLTKNDIVYLLCSLPKPWFDKHVTNKPHLQRVATYLAGHVDKPSALNLYHMLIDTSPEKLADVSALLPDSDIDKICRAMTGQQFNFIATDILQNLHRHQRLTWFFRHNPGESLKVWQSQRNRTGRSLDGQIAELFLSNEIPLNDVLAVCGIERFLTTLNGRGFAAVLTHQPNHFSDFMNAIYTHNPQLFYDEFMRTRTPAGTLLNDAAQHSAKATCDMLNLIARFEPKLQLDMLGCMSQEQMNQFLMDCHDKPEAAELLFTMIINVAKTFPEATDLFYHMGQDKFKPLQWCLSYRPQMVRPIFNALFEQLTPERTEQLEAVITDATAYMGRHACHPDTRDALLEAKQSIKIYKHHVDDGITPGDPLGTARRILMSCCTTDFFSYSFSMDAACLFLPSFSISLNAFRSTLKDQERAVAMKLLERSRQLYTGQDKITDISSFIAAFSKHLCEGERPKSSGAKAVLYALQRLCKDRKFVQRGSGMRQEMMPLRTAKRTTQGVIGPGCPGRDVGIVGPGSPVQRKASHNQNSRTTRTPGCP